jgi:hypothetical protein
MNSMTRWMALLCVLPILFAACGAGGGGGGGTPAAEPNFVLRLTDAPNENYESIHITFDGIFAIVEDLAPVSLEFADFDSPAIVARTEDSITIDLLQLSNGASIRFAFGDLPNGRVNQIRLIISDAKLYAYEEELGLDGLDDDDVVTPDELGVYAVKVPSGVQSGVKLNPRNVEIRGGSTISLLLDFEAASSIIRLGGADKAKGRQYHFILKPVIFILEEVRAIPIDTETVAVEFDFPTGLDVVEEPGVGSTTGEGNVLVADFAISIDDDHVVYDIDVSNAIPVEVSNPVDPNWDIFASSQDELGGEPLVNFPTGVTQNLGLVWIANAESAIGIESSGNVSEYGTDRNPRKVFVGNMGATESDEGLVVTSGIEFGGFAPNGSLSGDDLLVFQTNNNGSVTGINLGDDRIFDVLKAGALTEATDAAFVPEPFDGSGGAGTVIGRLFVTDGAANEVKMFPLMTSGPVGETATRIVPGAITIFHYTFASGPVGIAYSAGSDRLYIAHRGNGTITAAANDGTEIVTYDTGLGGDAINGIDAVYSVIEDADILFLTNTSSIDNPLGNGFDFGTGSLERAVAPIWPAP